MAQAPDVSARPLPRHVAIIMDGNGRWARRHGLPRTQGHRRGVEALRRTVQAAGDLGIGHLTVFGFSSENWKRPASEIDDLMWLLRRYLQSEIAELHKNNVRLKMIGDRTRLPSDVARMITEAESATVNNTALTCTVALNYGSRNEISAAARHLAEEAAAGRLDPAEITPDRLGHALETHDLPDPDLILRTSGEKRISNFLLWQAAYSELVFVDKLWPDFNESDLTEAIREYQRRERRYGAAVSSS
jgi:undecaprenyl diphosphate synthase